VIHQSEFFVGLGRRDGCPVAVDSETFSGRRTYDTAFSGIVGQSDQIQAVCRLVRCVARSDTTVLIQGESGTGKEIVANAIHANSRRCRAPFVKVNCAALTESLLESELFGHVKGAFTGAIRDRRGRFKQADGGTILLDEIGTMPISGQATLLRVLQEREFEPVGSSQTVPVNVRVIAAANNDLAKAVAEGTFRADLYYRLNVFAMVLPPLRERPEDVPVLADLFLDRYNRSVGKRIEAIGTAALSLLLGHDWPGNVRELENAIEHAVIVEDGAIVDSGSLPMSLRKSRELDALAPPRDLNLRERLLLAERQILLDTLARANGIRKRAAEMLGIDSRNMPYFLRKHHLQDKV
jgi:transcriptional regulator with GAF, ATPase, and Fis domain